MRALPLILLVACSPAPEELALAMCEVVPALTLDSAGQQMALEIADSEELQQWHDLPFSPGMDQLTTPGFGVVRANSECEVVDSVEEADGVRVSLLRREPDITTMRVWDPTSVLEIKEIAERRFELLVRDAPDGRRVFSDAARAREEAAAARALSGDERRAAFEALHAWFPDPTLLAEMEAVVVPIMKR